MEKLDDRPREVKEIEERKKDKEKLKRKKYFFLLENIFVLNPLIKIYFSELKTIQNQFLRKNKKRNVANFRYPNHKSLIKNLMKSLKLVKRRIKCMSSSIKLQLVLYYMTIMNRYEMRHLCVLCVRQLLHMIA